MINYIFITILCCNFVRTTNTCRPTNITILQCELDICMYILGSETLPYLKFRHISWEQMVTEHRFLSEYITADYLYVDSIMKSRLCINL